MSHSLVQTFNCTTGAYKHSKHPEKILLVSPFCVSVGLLLGKSLSTKTNVVAQSTKNDLDVFIFIVIM